MKMAENEPSTTDRVAALEARVAHLEADLERTKSSKEELLKENQALRRQTDKLTVNLVDSNALVGLEGQLQGEVLRLNERITHLMVQCDTLRGDNAHLMQVCSGEARMRRLLRRLYEIAIWAAERTPDEFAKAFGDTSDDFQRAETILREQ
jgi:hypothetical protein